MLRRDHLCFGDTISAQPVGFCGVLRKVKVNSLQALMISVFSDSMQQASCSLVRDCLAIDFLGDVIARGRKGTEKEVCSRKEMT